MSDYGHDLLFGTFVSPAIQPVRHAVDHAKAAERAGLDLVTFQDHPYQPRFHDTWTLMSYIAAQTERIRLSGNVTNLPLRQPAVLARSVASLDQLSGGRIELGIGAGGFWDAIAAMGGRRLTPGQSIEALEEGIGIIRQIWAVDERGGVRSDGPYYPVKGAKRGPAPAHDVGIWVGAYKPKMLALTGRVGDGWLPSLPYLPGGPADLAEMNRHIDEAALAAGREPRAVRRLLNIGGDSVEGPPQEAAERLAGLTVDYGISAFLLMSDDLARTELFAAEIAPAVRELVQKWRLGGGPR
uniref:LLM class flavin-dependent oxidoreductase n=1 Tax=Herbidospora sakaeratensis TaxID=564415 RepID=UPI000782DE26|nr:LLM class flavin-dependent oxidoreductase [Herbidospora sakaeratensis]